jgi:hypothetical protein
MTFGQEELKVSHPPDTSRTHSSVFLSDFQQLGVIHCLLISSAPWFAKHSGARLQWWMLTEMSSYDYWTKNLYETFISTQYSTL